MALRTDNEAIDEIITAVGDDDAATLATRLPDMWDRWLPLDTPDPSGQHRFLTVMLEAINLMMGPASQNVNESDAAGGQLSASDWFTHLDAMKKSVQADLLAYRKALMMALASIKTGTLATTSLSPQLPGQVGVLRDPADRHYLGDPSYRRLW